MVDLILAVTNECNSKCRMCSIWKEREKKRLSIEDIRSLPDGLGYVNLTGGEATLLPDFEEIVEILKKKSKKVFLSTNGFVHKNISDVEVRVSLDGEESVHDYLRGVKGAYKMATNSIKYYKEKNSVGICCTIMQENIGQFSKMYDLAKKEKIQFTGTFVQNSFYFRKNDNKIDESKYEDVFKDINYVVNDMIGGWNPWTLFRAYFFDQIKDLMKGKERKVRCGAGKRFFFIDWNGDVYPCNMLHWKLGNIHEEGFDDIRRRSREVTDCPRQCWLICTTQSEVRRRPYKFALWILRNKISLLLRWRKPKPF